MSVQVFRRELFKASAYREEVSIVSRSGANLFEQRFVPGPDFDVNAFVKGLDPGHYSAQFINKDSRWGRSITFSVEDDSPSSERVPLSHWILSDERGEPLTTCPDEQYGDKDTGRGEDLTCRRCQVLFLTEMAKRMGPEEFGDACVQARAAAELDREGNDD